MSKKSFIIYETIYDSLRELEADDFNEFARAIFEYGLYETVPDFKGLKKAMWVQIKFCIDNSKEFRETQAKNGFKGGRPSKNAKPNETQNNPTKPNETQNNPNVNVNVNVNEKEDDEEIASSPSPFSPPQENYAHIIFEKFRDNDLPCQRGNEFSFMSCDFKNALAKLNGINSADVIQAVDNYITELNDPESYITYRYSFDAFVGSKNFTKLLPANYVHENFRSYGKSVKSEMAKEAEDKRHEEQVSARKRLLSAHPVRCDVCGCELQDSSAGFGMTWMCRNCNSEWELKDGQWVKDG